MKLATCRIDDSERLGIVVGDEIVDARAAAPDAVEFADMISFIRAGQAAMRRARSIAAEAPASVRRKLADLRLAPPLRPSTILCSGSNYREHNSEKANTPLSGREPEFFVMTADCVIGPDEPIVHEPKLTNKLDCETELAVVIGKPGRHIPPERALEHVFGYTIVNDVTARDRQVRRTPEGHTWYELGRGKAFDGSAPIGPWVVTADEIPDPQALALKTRINGELRQSSTTANMIWTCAQLIGFFSVNFTLKPGMVIITGTPAGTAWSTDRELGGKWQGQEGLVPATRYCLPGDRIESEIEKIGILRNAVLASAGTG
jgi:2-keto-4-pentenoate hydratase/2-oxohepta-3-ene-1,7-dioic acid hydratase in catechol pathway